MTSHDCVATRNRRTSSDAPHGTFRKPFGSSAYAPAATARRAADGAPVRRPLRISDVAEPVLLPALAHARLVFGRRPHRRRKALAAPFGAALELPVAGGVDERAVPEAGAELRDVAVLERRARIDRR